MNKIKNKQHSVLRTLIPVERRDRVKRGQSGVLFDFLFKTV